MLESLPASEESLWQPGLNIVRLTYHDSITAPQPGEVLIREMLEGGAYGADLSDNFTFTVEDDDQGQLYVLKIEEATPSLTQRTWVVLRAANGISGDTLAQSLSGKSGD